MHIGVAKNRKLEWAYFTTQCDSILEEVFFHPYSQQLTFVEIYLIPKTASWHGKIAFDVLNLIFFSLTKDQCIICKLQMRDCRSIQGQCEPSKSNQICISRCCNHLSITVKGLTNYDREKEGERVTLLKPYQLGWTLFRGHLGNSLVEWSEGSI